MERYKEHKNKRLQKQKVNFNRYKDAKEGINGWNNNKNVSLRKYNYALIHKIVKDTLEALSLEKWDSKAFDELKKLNEQNMAKLSPKRRRVLNLRLIDPDLYEKYDESYVLERMVELIAKGANVNATNMLGDYALIHAVRTNNNKAVRLLIKMGADVNVKDSFDMSPIMYAMLNENNEMIKLLFKSNAELNYIDKISVSLIKNGFRIIKKLFG